jgi:mannose-1-phosphate guanylyltransferase
VGPRGEPGFSLERPTPLMMLIDQATTSDIALSAAYDRISPISIDHAVMEGAAADHRVVMGSMDVGWSDLGSWTALLAALAGGDARGATGRVVQTGETVELGADDLLVRPVEGHLTIAGAQEGTIVTDSVCAHLVGGRHLKAEVQALLDRVAHQEDRA